MSRKYALARPGRNGIYKMLRDVDRVLILYDSPKDALDDARREKKLGRKNTVVISLEGILNMVLEVEV